ncbi:MAG TPA: DinB family protein [Bryobacteraceae bacterium]|nr:DinB family protein [Bryobacteraceae bacterium]
MKCLLAVTLVTVWVLSAQEADPLSTDARAAYADVKNNILRSAEKMPEENYNFKPAPRVRTFGQILGHIAEEQYIYCGAVRGEQKAADIEKTKTSKADLIAALHDSFAYCDAAYSLTDAAATQMVQAGSRQRTRLYILWANTLHDTSHYGNLVTYLRIKGLVPPSTEGQ